MQLLRVCNEYEPSVYVRLSLMGFAQAVNYPTSFLRVQPRLDGSATKYIVLFDACLTPDATGMLSVESATHRRVVLGARAEVRAQSLRITLGPMLQHVAILFMVVIVIGIGKLVIR